MIIHWPKNSSNKLIDIAEMLCQQATFFFVTVLPYVLSKDSNYLSVSIAYAIMLSILSMFKKSSYTFNLCCFWTTGRYFGNPLKC